MNNEENIRVLIGAWKALVERLPAGAVQHADGVATVLGNVPMPFLNFCVPDHPLPDAGAVRAALKVIRDRLNSFPHATFTAISEEWAPPDWRIAAEAEGFTYAMDLTFMATDGLLPARRTAPALEFRRVTNDEGARDISAINAHAYGMSLDMFDCTSNQSFWGGDTFAFVGYDGSRPVTSAAALPVENTNYVAFVATMPDAYGKGYAEAVMRHAIEQCRQISGFTRVTLHATDMGRPLYRSMGFDSGAKTALLSFGETR